MIGTVEHYADRLRRYDDNRDRRSAFIGTVEAIAGDPYATPEVIVARLRAAVAALRQIESEGR